MRRGCGFAKNLFHAPGRTVAALHVAGIAASADILADKPEVRPVFDWNDVVAGLRDDGAARKPKPAYRFFLYDLGTKPPPLARTQ